MYGLQIILKVHLLSTTLKYADIVEWFTQLLNWLFILQEELRIILK
jgi:hypothetical protein